MIEHDAAARVAVLSMGYGQVGRSGERHGKSLRTLLRHSTVAREPIAQAIGLRIVLDLVAELELRGASEQRFVSGLHVRPVLAPEAVQVGFDGRTGLLGPGIAWRSVRLQRVELAPYVAPEHIDGSTADVRGHVFSLGVLLWEMLACRSLFGAATFADVRERVLHAPIPRVQRAHFVRGEPIAAAMAGVVAQALRRNPEDRFQSYAELASALRKAGPIAEYAEVAELLVGGSGGTAFEAVSSSSVSSAPPAAPGRTRIHGDPTDTCELPTSDSDPTVQTRVDAIEVAPTPRESAATTPRRARAGAALGLALALLAIGGWAWLRGAPADGARSAYSVPSAQRQHARVSQTPIAPRAEPAPIAPSAAPEPVRASEAAPVRRAAPLAKPRGRAATAVPGRAEEFVPEDI